MHSNLGKIHIIRRLEMTLAINKWAVKREFRSIFQIREEKRALGLVVHVTETL